MRASDSRGRKTAKLKQNPQTKKIPAEAGRVRGIVGRKTTSAPEESVQSGPANQLYGFLVQIEIAGQNGLDVTRIRALRHWVVELDHAAEFVAVAVLRVGQNELGVVLR